MIKLLGIRFSLKGVERTYKLLRFNFFISNTPDFTLFYKLLFEFMPLVNLILNCGCRFLEL